MMCSCNCQPQALNSVCWLHGNSVSTSPAVAEFCLDWQQIWLYCAPIATTLPTADEGNTQTQAHMHINVPTLTHMCWLLFTPCCFHNAMQSVNLASKGCWHSIRMCAWLPYQVAQYTGAVGLVAIYIYLAVCVDISAHIYILYIHICIYMRRGR